MRKYWQASWKVDFVTMNAARVSRLIAFGWKYYDLRVVDAVDGINFYSRDAWAALTDKRGAWKLQIVDEKTGEMFDFLKLNDVEGLEEEMNAAA